MTWIRVESWLRRVPTPQRGVHALAMHDNTLAAQGMAADRSVSARPAFVRGFIGRIFGVFSDAEAWQTRLKSGFRGYNEKRSYETNILDKPF